ncbi:hypothetical protein F511_37323 [Dorcoceras hygrometricum]|uniref:Uncharacterized protein n=1 Tax=Dorcoceras hygrometricum TaxID=472368 RepID=A0A2Z7D182_9LAMI|nr:hypothetical protein F511_37323 [Dorcoceras hygrometricum]
MGTRSPIKRSWSRIISANHDPQKAPGSDQFHEETGTSNARTDSSLHGDRNKSDQAKNRATTAAVGEQRRWAVGGGVRRVGEGIQLVVGPQPEFVSGSLELNILHLPLFRHGKDPLEEFDYNDPRCNPLLRPAAARTPSIYHCTPARKLCD